MYLEVNFDVRFRAPFGMLICGPTMSGKTVFVERLINTREHNIDKPVGRVVYCYGEWQPAFDRMLNVEFIKGISGVLDTENFFNPQSHTLLILDDLAQDIANHPKTPNCSHKVFITKTSQWCSSCRTCTNKEKP